MSLIRSHILVCTGTGCTSSESPKIIAEFEKQLAAQGMDKEAQVVRTGCFGLCALGPIVTIYPEGACYTHVTVDDVEEIVAEHIVKGRIVKRLLNKNEGGDGPATSLAETRFYKHQHRIALRNCGVINPESIDEYIGVDGYAALGKILTEQLPPQQVIDTVLASGLRTLTNIMERDDHFNVLAVSHSGACFNFLRAIQDPTEELNKGFGNCCIFVYQFNDGVFKLEEVIRHKYN